MPRELQEYQHPRDVVGAVVAVARTGTDELDEQFEV